MKIKKIIIPAAGLGTRFLPITKSVPKEMLPLLNKPALQNIIEEGVSSNITDFTIIISDEKKEVIQDFFTKDPHLDEILKKRSKGPILHELNRLIDKSSFTYVNQKEPRGLGHAILCGQGTIVDEFFGIILPDDIIVNPAMPTIGQLAVIAYEYKASVIAVQEVAKEVISSYGIVSTTKKLNERTWQINSVIEKPSAEQAPSNLAIIGRYIFSSILFEYLKKTKPGKGNEIQLTDAIQAMLADNHPVLAYKFEGKRFDLGTPVGWLEANLFFAHSNPAFANLLT